MHGHGLNMIFPLQNGQRGATARSKMTTFGSYTELKAEEEAWLLAHPRWGGTREGEEVAFTYSPEVQIDETYYWLNAWSSRLEDVREELGLPRSDWYTEPPDHSHCFHATIGNTKSV